MRRCATLIDERSRDYYLDDVDCPLAYEPSGEDFLSPCLAEADLMRRVLRARRIRRWLSSFLPGMPRDEVARLARARHRDGSQGPEARAHRRPQPEPRLDAATASRSGLPAGDPRRASLESAARAPCAMPALPAVTGEHYEGGHWLGSFAVYLLGESGRGGDSR